MLSRLAEHIYPIRSRNEAMVLFPKLRKIVLAWLWPDCGKGQEHNSDAETWYIRTGYTPRNNEVSQRENLGIKKFSVLFAYFTIYVAFNCVFVLSHLRWCIMNNFSHTVGSPAPFLTFTLVQMSSNTLCFYVHKSMESTYCMWSFKGSFNSVLLLIPGIICWEWTMCQAVS